MSSATKTSGRVVIHTPEPLSSAALYVQELSTALAGVDVPVRVLCPANHQWRAPMEANPMIEVRACCPRATNPEDAFPNKIFQNLRFIFSSSRALLKALHRGDIAHFQYILHLPFGLIFFLCALTKGAHVFLTVHDPLPHKFLFPRAFRFIEMAAFRLAYKLSDVLMVHSEAGKQKLIEAFGVPQSKVRVILHGPYQLKERVQPCVASDRLEVLFFGSLRENKGLHLAIEAVTQLAGEGLPIRLTIAGRVVNRNEKEYGERCKKLIDPHSAAIRLIENFIPDEQLPALFSDCHCFVLPYTSFSSDSGVAYMAIANSKPIVSTESGGLGWLLRNSGGGLPIAEANVPAVKAALRRAFELGPKQLQQMGETGAAWVLSECGWPRIARNTQTIYSEVIPQLSEKS